MRRKPEMLILIVEDDTRTAQFLRRGLREENHEVDVVENGEDAVRQGTSQPYDVLLLDWMLPDIDGLSVLRKWRDAGVTEPVIMLTARTGVDSAVLALDTGADDYIEKPFSFEELLARLRAQTRRTGGGDVEAQAADVGPASVDLRARVVEHGSETHELTAREFALLDFLLKYRGEVVGRGRILDRVWEMSHNPTTNVVDVYIRRLREMLDPPDLEGTDGSIIETVRGEGYRLRPQEEWGAEDE